jgi:hypothetical protein
MRAAFRTVPALFFGLSPVLRMLHPQQHDDARLATVYGEFRNSRMGRCRSCSDGSWNSGQWRPALVLSVQRGLVQRKRNALPKWSPAPSRPRCQGRKFFAFIGTQRRPLIRRSGRLGAVFTQEGKARKKTVPARKIEAPR